MVGVNFSNSMIQLLRTESGQTTRNGPHVPFERKWARKEMVWRVWTSAQRLDCALELTLPSPISSAKIPLRPFSYKLIIH